MSDDNLQILFTLERETKNTVRYQELTDPPAIGTIYIRKWVAKDIGGGEYPVKIILTLEASR